MCNEKRAQSKQLESRTRLIYLFLHKPMNCPELAPFSEKLLSSAKKLSNSTSNARMMQGRQIPQGSQFLGKKPSFLRVHQLYVRGKKINLFPLLIVMKSKRTQHQTAGEDGETARGSEKETKPCRSCRDLFCSRGDPPVASTKLASVAYLCS